MNSIKKQKFIIGTRGSLLARTQSQQVKDQLEKLTGLEFEFKKILTEGDQNTEKPLWQMDGKDFFTKELDQALLSKEVDLVIHSYKDLGSERPPGIHLGAITKRSYGHDILLLKKSTIKNISTMDSFIVGTSSPRRITNIEKSLKPFLPNAKENLSIETKVLRGNVPTRIKKLLDSNQNYDAIVLAYAGLERLSLTQESREILKELVKELDFFILPQSLFPAAAAQGALGIECRTNDTDVLSILSHVHDDETSKEVAIERKYFNSYGGGCHLAVGINAKKMDSMYIVHHRGQLEKENAVVQEINKSELINHKYNQIQQPIFLGLPRQEKNQTTDFLYDEYLTKNELSYEENLISKNVFFTSKYCMQTLKNFSAMQTLWSSGISTHQLLVKNGYWVNGSADSLGHHEIQAFQNSAFLQLMLGNNDGWIVLSEKSSKSPIGEIIPCYERLPLDVSKDFEAQIHKIQSFYWTSFPQYQAYVKRFPSIKDKTHCCGLGKTWQRFKASKLNIKPFINIQAFKDWVQDEKNK